MADKSVKKVSSKFSPRGEMGQTYLASGKRTSMRLWEREPEEASDETAHSRDYETVGYLIQGKVHLHLEGQEIHLDPGDSWVVPAGAEHRYEILEPATAVEATAPPARVAGRDEKT